MLPNLFMFTAVPRLLEKFYDGIVTKGRAAGGVKTVIFNWALGVVLEWDPSKEGHGLYGFKLKIARKLVFSKVKEALGLTGIKAVGLWLGSTTISSCTIL